ncbi:hypothetical protein ROZALSC1DRAFT_26714 [Rozella allomycis CSF55]|uniref:Clathrin adaptor, mu subunit domain-containing protein n=1 Tax=Rozella allomycis (strain CSF55) TaxID=988480 RepID=A0A075AMU4_ROZAC|nr:Clathrin adaptor, mu subunit domain-containing protein [Rozella allomycis CSF55]RKP21920.1 hypothetical protein ROZALSC1DRAFT_26714 [Rozella allomycis CSF55]|eukprot:EPZ30993.1 Clathrin adaptor, mu subunit domain-containing protein [Rozella allomycis CSF55]
MLSALFILNFKGEVLVSRSYRPEGKRSLADVFRIQVVSAARIKSPVITVQNTTFFHIHHENIYLVAASSMNTNAATVFEFLYKVVHLGKGYFGKFNEEAVKSNFCLIYELFDEILDIGYPQNTELDTLKQYITTESVKNEMPKEVSKITIQATGATSWRRSDIKYRKNEAFVDVVESVNLIMSSKGNVLRSDVSGQIVMKAFLSGMPECKIGLNDKIINDKEKANTAPGIKPVGTVELDDCQFHQCVKLGKFETERTISFVPPDGEFELMKYRTTENVNPPFKIIANLNESSKNRIDFKITVKSCFSTRLFANNVIIKIPVPPNTSSSQIRSVIGKAKYVPAENAIIWKISRFQGDVEVSLSSEVELSSTTTKKAWSRPPISMAFEVPMFTASGLLVRFLKNINDKIGKVELKKTLYELFATYGQIIALVVSKAPKSRGQAFIVFKDIPSATNAMRNLQSYPFFDKPIVIQYAKTKSKATKDIEKWASEHVNEMPYLSALLPEKKSSTATLAAASAVVAEKASLEKEAKEREVSEKVNKVSENQKSEVDSKILDEYTNRILFLENLPVEANETLLSLLFEQ